MTAPDRAARRRVLGQAGALVAAHLGLALGLYALIDPPRHAILPGIVVAIAFAQAVSIVGMCAALVLRRLYGEFAAARSGQLRGPIQDALSAALVDANAHTEALRLARSHPREVEERLVELFPAVKGTARQALSKLAFEMGMVQRWREELDSRRTRKRRRAARYLGLLSPDHSLDARSAMMSSGDAEVRVEALRMLARSGEPAALAAALRLYGMVSRFHRVLIAEDLRPHAARLCESSFEKVLSGADASRIIATLELPYCWKRTFSAPAVHRLLSHADAGVRAAALRVLPYETSGHTAAGAVLRLLSDQDPRVREMAALVAGKLRLADSLALLGMGIEDADAGTARSCAMAMTELGPAGLAALEGRIADGEGKAAAVAMEALERARLGRAEVWA